MTHVWIVTHMPSYRLLGVFSSSDAAVDSVRYTYHAMPEVVIEVKQASRVVICIIHKSQNEQDEIRIERQPIEHNRCHL